MKRYGSATVWAATGLTVVLLLTGCEANPAKENVTSKNSDLFNDRFSSDAQRDAKADDTEMSSESLGECSFSSMDSSVVYHINTDFPDTKMEMPAVEVVPYSFTEEDARQIAEILFPDSEAFEYDRDCLFSQEELKARISFFSEYLSSDDALANVYGNYMDDSSVSRLKGDIQAIVDSYSDQLKSGNQSQQACEWRFYPSGHYSYRTEGNLEIKAVLEHDGESYTFSVVNRDESDYKIHNISAYLSESSFMHVAETDLRIYSMCKSSAPSEDQLYAIKAQLNEQLNAMGIGTWHVDQCYREEVINGEYMVNATAVPIFNNSVVVRQNQLTNLKRDDIYSSNYYYTDAEFAFSPSGQLIRCQIYSPVEVVEVVNNNVSILSVTELYDRMETNLKYRSLYDYMPEGFYPSDHENILGVVDINEIVYGLTRIKVKDKPDHYYYVPAITIRGTFEAVDKTASANANISNNPNKRTQTLLVINAVDGTVIDVSKGY